MILQESGKIWVKLRIGLKAERGTSNIEKKLNWEGSTASRQKDLNLKNWRKELQQKQENLNVTRLEWLIIDEKRFRCSQKVLYEDIGGKRMETSDPPLADDARAFWSETWNKTVQLKKDAEWLLKVEKELEVVKIQNKPRKML